MAELVQGVERPDERVLRCVLRLALITCDEVGDSERDVLVSGNECLVRIDVSVLRPCGKFCIVQWSALHGRISGYYTPRWDEVPAAAWIPSRQRKRYRAAVVGLYVHGGVSGLKKDVLPDLSASVAAGLNEAAVIDMVEVAVRVLEDDADLNAGFGAVLDLSGNVDLDAGIADGTSGSFGAVAGVRVANPITLARRVLESTPHGLMVGAGAALLGRDLPEVQIAPPRRAEWEQAKKDGKLDPSRFGHPDKVDTVGAVALDAEGRLAAGSSTGGVFGKMPGRVGDSPVFGAGFYASELAAVVGTGVGELFLETLACARAGHLIENGSHPQDACEEIVRFLGRRASTSAGLIALDVRANVGASFRGGSLSVFGPDGRVDPVELA